MKKILIIYTGGTIGMHHDHNGVLKPFDFGRISEHVPELKKLKCKIDYHSFKNLIDSSNVQPPFWIELADIIEKKYKQYDGFIILHGTDTMAYSASALSFMLSNLQKPVIFTGSQLPLGTIRTDARRNLITSIELAIGEILIPEVCIYFNSQLFRGNRAEKFTASKFDAFQSLNYPVLAETGVEIQYNHQNILKRPKKALAVFKNLSSNIGLVRIFPGITEQWMRNACMMEGLKALVLETYGSGNAPTEKWFIKCLSDAIKKGLIVVNVSQCSGGAVQQGKYETSDQLQKIGVVSGRDMTTEAALTKLMFLFGKEKSVEKIIKQFQKSLCGEMSDN